MGDVELTLQQSAGLLRVAAACEKGRIVSESCHGYFGRLGQVAGKNIIEDWAKHRTLGYPPLDRKAAEQYSFLFEALPYSAIDTVDLLYGRVMFSEPILVVWYYVVYF
ncbi:hypothetical protein EVAR_16794_1 [Eumeta japonica]|uniref:Uncharacterized protein n=1 Tax=Eumeta variegata TaxID=151549 RepID=A0A4C1UKX2_EUMVA|nr:hypothetical protein EVAR_16794_1 [Eumeta japonica]